MPDRKYPPNPPPRPNRPPHPPRPNPHIPPPPWGKPYRNGPPPKQNPPPKPPQPFTPFLSGLLGLVVQDGFSGITAMNLLSDIYPFVSEHDKKRIEEILGFRNNISRQLGGQTLPTYHLRRTLTEKQRLSELFSILGKYGGVRSGNTLRMLESLISSGALLRGNSDPSVLIAELMRNGAFAGLDLSKMFSMLGGSIDPSILMQMFNR